MTRIRLILLCMLAALAVSALGATAAQAECSGTAPEHKCIWEIKFEEGEAFAELAATEEYNVETNHETATFILTQGATHEIRCTEVGSDGQIIGGKPGTGRANKIEWGSCTLPNETTCKVKSKGNLPYGEIEASNSNTKLREDENSTGLVKNILALRFEQKLRKGTKEFVTLEFGSGAEETKGAGTRFERKVATGACTKYPASTKVKGSVDAEVEVEKLKFPKPALKQSTLEAFGLAATLEGSAKVIGREPGEYRGN